MLGKLMKYELKSTARILIPLNISILILAVFTKLFTFSNSFDYSSMNHHFLQIIKTLPMIAYIFIIFTTMIATVFVIVQRFYKNYLCDEGYLMFTLPTKTNSLIVSKLLVSVIWVLAGIITVILSIMFLSLGSGTVPMMFEVMRRATENLLKSPYVPQAIIIASEFILLLIIQMTSVILQSYASLSVGQLFSSHKIIASFGAFIGFNIITQIFSGIVVSIFASVSIFNSSFSFIDKSGLSFIAIFLGTFIVISLLFMIGYYIVTHYIIKNKLNLE